MGQCLFDTCLQRHLQHLKAVLEELTGCLFHFNFYDVAGSLHQHPQRARAALEELASERSR